ncbi:MAG: VCBS domain-containing protein, partial [bacterium]
LTDTFTYTMTDTAGLTSTSTVTITIQGSNDNPVAIVDNSDAVEAGGVSNATTGSNGTGNVLTNDTDVDSNANGETKAVTGIVAGISPSAVANVGSTVTGTYGSIVLNSDGSYTYVVDNTNTAVQALRLNSQTLDDVFTYTVTDTGGLTSTTQLTVTVRGRNDNPVGVNDTATAVEAGGYANATTGTTPTGNVLANDTDVDSAANGETKTVNGVVAGASASASGSVGTSVTGTYGSINITSDGGYTYTVDNSNVTVQALRTSGQSLSEVFTYSVVDAGGLSSLATITITVTGQNDAPVSSNDTNTAVEAGGVSNGTSGTNPTGNVLTNDSDVDSNANGETKSVIGVVAGGSASASGSVGSSVTGTYGSISIAADGSYTYNVDNANAAVQALRLSSQTLTDTFTYTMTDTAGLTSTSTVTITIQGSNDNPVAIVDNSDAVEAGGV